MEPSRTSGGYKLTVMGASEFGRSCGPHVGLMANAEAVVRKQFMWEVESAAS